MNATILCVGRMKEKPYRMMADEYLKRLSRFGKIDECELDDLPEKQNASPAEEIKIKEKEGERILAKIRPSDYVIALTLEGKMLDSPAFSQHLTDLTARGASHIVFVIGGSLGLSPQVVARADEQLCLGKMTYPHQLARVMLYEQVYRAMKIAAGERYHK